MPKKTELVGKKKEHLQILSEVGKNFICKCDCGNICEIPKYKVYKNMQSTCGCHIGVKNVFEKECKSCGKKFEGGPRAWYCPECRAERQKESSRISAQRQSAGKSLKIGSEMLCEICGKTIIRNSARQKYCADCAKERLMEIDRKRAMERYGKDRDTINANRKEQRKAKEIKEEKQPSED